MSQHGAFSEYFKKAADVAKEEVVQQIGRLTFTRTDLIVLREKDAHNRFRLNDIVGLRLYKRSGTRNAVLDFMFAMTLLFLMSIVGYNYVLHMDDPQKPLIGARTTGELITLLLIAMSGVAVIGFCLVYFTRVGGQWWWLELTTEGGTTYNFPVAKTSDVKGETLRNALSDLHLPLRNNKAAYK